jgi:2-amino-4-hydroxy-6-hydroxymethyldihydropteridine diphosphokinase
LSKTAYIGIGSNLGNKVKNCLQAIETISKLDGCRLMGQSRFYRTEPVSVEGQEWYINGAASLETDISAHNLLERLQHIEVGMGRLEHKKWDPRIIDLDLLLFGRDIIDEEKLAVPHPLMHLRRFVLIPMTHLAPDLVHPVLGKTMIELLDEIHEEGQSVIPIEEV